MASEKEIVAEMVAGLAMIKGITRSMLAEHERNTLQPIAELARRHNLTMMLSAFTPAQLAAMHISLHLQESADRENNETDLIIDLFGPVHIIASVKTKFVGLKERIKHDMSPGAAWLELVYVTKRYRGRNLGHFLVALAAAELRERGYTELHTQIAAGEVAEAAIEVQNAADVKLVEHYGKLGFVRREPMEYQLVWAPIPVILQHAVTIKVRGHKLDDEKEEKKTGKTDEKEQTKKLMLLLAQARVKAILSEDSGAVSVSASSGSAAVSAASQDIAQPAQANWKMEDSDNEWVNSDNDEDDEEDYDNDENYDEDGTKFQSEEEKEKSWKRAVYLRELGNNAQKKFLAEQKVQENPRQKWAGEITKIKALIDSPTIEAEASKLDRGRPVRSLVYCGREKHNDLREIVKVLPKYRGVRLRANPARQRHDMPKEIKFVLELLW